MGRDGICLSGWLGGFTGDTFGNVSKTEDTLNQHHYTINLQQHASPAGLCFE